MSSFLWAFLSFLSGWSIETLFRGFSAGEPPNNLIEKIKRAVQPRPDDGLVPGIVHASPGQAPEQPTTDKIPEDFRFLLLLFGLAGGLLLFFIAAAQVAGYQPGFDLEEFVATKRVVWVLTWMTIGAIASAYRGKLCDLLIILFNILSTKENTILWPVQAAIAVGLFAGAVLMVHPQLLDKLTSLKAGSVEANFASAAGTAKITSAPVRLLSLSRISVAPAWEAFKLRSLDWKCVNTRPDRRRDAFCKADHDMMYRDAMYRAARVNLPQVAFAQKLFDEQLSPIFSYIQKKQEDINLELKLQDIGIKLQDANIKEYVLELANLTIRSMKITGEANEQNREQIWRSEEDELDTLDRQVSAIVGRKMDYVDTLGSRQVSFDQIRNSAGCKCLNWDLYVVASVADLLGIVESERVRADYLERARDFALQQSISCGECRYTIPSVTNFYYYLNDAKIKSEEPWPFEEMVADMRLTFDAIKSIAPGESDIQQIANLPQFQSIDLQNTYKKIELQDLSLGLEMFYLRALTGAAIHKADLQLWQTWLDKTRQILAATESVGVATGLADEPRWQEAAPNIRSNPATLFDAATSAALSLVLLPNQTGEVSAHDCLGARSALNYAWSLTYQPTFIQQVAGIDSNAESVADGQFERVLLARGFLEEANARVEAECDK